MLDYGLAASEGSGDAGCAALGDGEERIYDPLTGHKGGVG